jgi:flavin reductase (DIM6/NTAB) family NADH-FMN oxidoreductase RutF
VDPNIGYPLYPIILVGAGEVGGEMTLSTITLAAHVCERPPLVAVGVMPTRQTHELIARSGEFTCNMPRDTWVELSDWVGTRSGREHDKFKQWNLTAVAGDRVKAPLVAESPLSLECVVEQSLSLGSHDLFIARVVAAHADEAYLDERGALAPGRLQTLVQLVGYCRAGEYLAPLGCTE